MMRERRSKLEAALTSLSPGAQNGRAGGGGGFVNQSGPVGEDLGGPVEEGDWGQGGEVSRASLQTFHGSP